MVKNGSLSAVWLSFLFGSSDINKAAGGGSGLSVTRV